MLIDFIDSFYIVIAWTYFKKNWKGTYNYMFLSTYR